MRYHSTTGLTHDQITELVARVAQVAPPRDRRDGGRPSDRSWVCTARLCLR